MHNNFITLKEEKRDVIINAALTEFSAKGFSSASTNVIVTTAKISKGALFHYFKSKEALFSFLCGYVFDIVISEYYEKIPHMNGDLIDRLRDAYKLKQRLFERYPPIFEFVKRINQEPPGILGEKITLQMRDTMNIGYKKMMDNLDISLFRSDAPPDKVKNLVFWSLEGYGNRKIAQLAEVSSSQLKSEGIEQELEEYLAILRRCYYR